MHVSPGLCDRIMISNHFPKLNLVQRFQLVIQKHDLIKRSLGVLIWLFSSDKLPGTNKDEIVAVVIV